MMRVSTNVMGANDHGKKSRKGQENNGAKHEGEGNEHDKRGSSPLERAGREVKRRLRQLLSGALRRKKLKEKKIRPKKSRLPKQ